MPGPLTQLPWQLLLPSDRTKPVLLLGASRPQELPDGWRFETSETAGPFAAAVRLPGGLAPQSATLDRLSKILLPGGHLLWVSDRAPSSSALPRLPSWSRPACFVASGRALRSPHADWAQPLHGTGKMDLAIRLFQRASRRISHSAGHRITVMVPGKSGGGGWIFDLIEDLARRGVADVGPDGLGRIDRTGTGMAIGQIAGRSGERFALKVGLIDRAAREMIDECRCLDTLKLHSTLSAEILNVLPRILASGEFFGIHYRLDFWIPGRPASEFMYRLRARAEAVEQAIRWITEFHKGTLGPARDATADAEFARSVILGVSSRVDSEDRKLADQVADYLKERLDQYAVPAVHGHGDYWLGNVICERPAGPIRGIIDWKQSEKKAPPLEDIFHLLFHRKWLFSVYDPGTHLAAFFERQYGRRDRRLIAQYLRDLDLDPKVTGPMAVLYWVRYLATREPLLAARRSWYSRSYLRVRRSLERRLGSDLDQLGRWVSES